jgi:N-acetylglucosamine-6-phosphate deacetylase
MTIYIEPQTILTPRGTVSNHAVIVDGDRISAVGPASELHCPPGAQQLQAEGFMLAPGFIDLQINGAFGMDFTAEPDSIWRVAARLPRYGVTSFLPTIITSPRETVEVAQKVVQSAPPDFRGAWPLGLHLEGPFLNPAKRGAHDPAYMRLPDPEVIREWSPQSGVRLVTLAPELPGALELARALAARGIVVSAGHSMATVEQARAGFEAGISYGTHIFNAMPPLDHRQPGLAGAILADPRVTAGMIADGIHLHPDIVSLVWKAKGAAGTSLVTDAMAALGIDDGRWTMDNGRPAPGNHQPSTINHQLSTGVFRLGDREVITDGVSARLVDGTLAGSVLSMDRAVRNLVAFAGCGPDEAIGTVTAVPAKLLGIEAQRGSIAPGMVADFVLLTEDLRVAATMARGEVVYSVDG